MARKIRRGIITLHGSVAAGAADATNLILGPDATASVALVNPFDSLTFIGAEVVQRVAGTGTGTFSCRIDVGSTPVSETTAATFIDADAVAGTVQGFIDGNGNAGAAGQQIKLTTVKTGTVSGNATLAITMMFAVSGYGY